MTSNREEIISMLLDRPKGPFDAHAWPGGYPLFYLMKDRGILCPECMNKEFRLVFEATMDQDDDQWELVAIDANLQDPSLYCDHCYKRIPSAYAEE